MDYYLKDYYLKEQYFKDYYSKDYYLKDYYLKDYAPVWMYEFNYKHNHSLANFDPANPGQFIQMVDFRRGGEGGHCR